jgi:hypothetical protein
MYGTHDGLGAHRAGLEPSDAVSHGVGRAERIPSCCRWRQSRGAQRPRRIGERDEWAAPGTGDGLARSRFPRARLRPSWAHIDQRGLHPHATRRQPVTQLAGHDPGGQVRSALSLEPPKQDLRPPAHRPWPLHARRLGFEPVPQAADAKHRQARREGETCEPPWAPVRPPLRH